MWHAWGGGERGLEGFGWEDRTTLLKFIILVYGSSSVPSHFISPVVQNNHYFTITYFKKHTATYHHLQRLKIMKNYNVANSIYITVGI